MPGLFPPSPFSATNNPPLPFAPSGDQLAALHMRLVAGLRKGGAGTLEQGGTARGEEEEKEEEEEEYTASLIQLCEVVQGLMVRVGAEAEPGSDGGRSSSSRGAAAGSRRGRGSGRYDEKGDGWGGSRAGEEEEEEGPPLQLGGRVEL